MNQFSPDSYLTIREQFMLENPGCVLTSDCDFERCFQAGRRFELVRIALGASFVIFMNLLILNLLIAYFTTSYEQVRSRAEGLWAHHRTLLVSNYFMKNYALTNIDTVYYYCWRLPKNLVFHIKRSFFETDDKKTLMEQFNDFITLEFRGFQNEVGADKIEASDKSKGENSKDTKAAAIKKLIKFEKIMAHEVTNMIEFHRFSLKEKDDKEFSRRDEMEKFMTESREGSSKSREMILEISREMKQMKANIDMTRMSDLSEESREGSLKFREMILEISREMKQMNAKIDGLKK